MFLIIKKVSVELFFHPFFYLIASKHFIAMLFFVCILKIVNDFHYSMFILLKWKIVLLILVNVKWLSINSNGEIAEYLHYFLFQEKYKMKQILNKQYILLKDFQRFHWNVKNIRLHEFRNFHVFSLYHELNLRFFYATILHFDLSHNY